MTGRCNRTEIVQKDGEVVEELLVEIITERVDAAWWS
jgi:hypothetical protein